jgi:hypothetical protein
MLLSSLKKIGCNCLIRITGLCRGGVSQLNHGGYNSISGRKRHIHSLESVYSISQNCKKEAKQWLNDASSRLNPRNQDF